MDDTCHVCEDVKAEFTCAQCEEPVCEDCCVIPTYENQLECTLCVVCGDNNECDRQEEISSEWKREEAEKLKRDLINSKRKATYWKPENIEKRRVAKIKRNRERVDQNRKMLEEAFKIFNSMIR